MAFSSRRREIGAWPVLRGDGAHPQRPDIVTAIEFRPFQHFAPSKDRLSGKQRCDVASTVDSGDMEGVGEPVERKRARQ